MKQLIEIQSELKAPKNQRNSFGNYNYRSAEDILEAVKPLLKNHECHLTISDEIILIGDRYYVKAEATLTSKDEHISVSAFAREESTKKGMDSSQITGSASSYARKYALNGLFCIDDTKDADFTNTHGKEQKPEMPTLDVNGAKWNDAKLAVENGTTVENIKKYYKLTKNAEKELTAIQDKV